MAKVRYVEVECLRLKVDGEDGAMWIDSNGGVVATRASYRFVDPGSLALERVPPSGKYEGLFSDDSGQRRDAMTLTFTRTGDGACTVEGFGRSPYGRYKMSGSGTRDGDGWGLSLVRTPVEEAQAPRVTGQTLKSCQCGKQWPPGKMYCQPGCGTPLTERARIEAAMAEDEDSDDGDVR